MKRPLAYITAPWKGGAVENAEQAAQYCRAVYEAGYSAAETTVFLLSRWATNLVWGLEKVKILLSVQDTLFLFQ